MKTGVMPEDQVARHRAAGDLDRTLFVEASAGTGKTSLLVERVVALITTGRARMDQIAAITFTEAAAAELRDRLSQRFDQMAGPDPNDPATAAAEALESAAVSTVHGFARRILSEHPFEVGLPPGFEVADAGAHRIAFDQRFDALVDHLLRSDEQAELIGLVLSSGVTWEQCKALAWACEEQWERLTLPPPPGPPPALDTAALIGCLERAVGLAGVCADGDDPLLIFLQTQTTRHLDAVRDAREPLDVVQVLSDLPRLTAGNKGRAANWRGGGGHCHKEEVGGLLEQAQAEHGRLVSGLAQWLLSALSSLIIGFTLEGVAARRRDGCLTFHDLLVLACELVREHPAVRRDLHDRYTHLLVDEFQDTDPLQVELAFFLAADPAHEEGGSWEALSVESGRLFLVGDPKQSIYRFRRADIDVFTRAREHLGGELVRLTSNFRSRPGIVEWVNAVFADALGEGVSGCQPPYEPIAAFRAEANGGPRGLRPVIVLGHEPMEGPIAAVRAAQATDVAQALASMHAEQWPIGPDASPLRYRDVAVLVRNRASIPSLEDAFVLAGVPYRLESSSLVYQCDEIRQLVSLFRAIDDPTDAVSVLAALRSPAFGCGDDELMAHAHAGGRWNPLLPGSGTVVADALAELGEAHARRWWQGVSELIGEVVEHHGFLAQGLAGSRPRESWRRIQFLLDQARRFEGTGGGDLRGFLRWVEYQQADGAQAVEVVLPETDEDAVRITTMHAAKGLEFPVAVLVGLEAPPRTESPPLLIDADGAHVRIGRPLQTPGYERAREFERTMERFEQRRLLYVAATRARDLLVVSLHRSSSSQSTLAHEMAEHCARHAGTWSDGGALCVSRPAALAEPVPMPDPALFELAAREQWAKERLVVLEQAGQPRSVAATAVHRLCQGAPADADDGGAAATGARTRRGRAGTAIGRAVHSVLQVIDLREGCELDTLCRSHAAFEGVTERTSEVRALVCSALEADVVRDAVASGRYWREVYVGVPMGERVLEGFIDLLVETPDGLMVVDYKTDRLEDPDDGDWHDRYRLQAASYAVAVEATLGRPVTRCTLLALAPGGARAVTIGDLNAAKAEVRDLFGQLTS